MKVRIRLVIDESNWPLLTGSHCLEVAVKADLTVYKCEKTCKRRKFLIWKKNRGGRGGIGRRRERLG